MDERLVVSKVLRQIILRSLHYGHPGRDSMLSTVSNVWWPRLHPNVVGIAGTCPQCRTAGKIIKALLKQNQIGELPKCKEANFLRKPNTEKVIEFLKKYIARHGIPQKIRTDPAAIFRGKDLRNFVKKKINRGSQKFYLHLE